MARILLRQLTAPPRLAVQLGLLTRMSTILEIISGFHAGEKFVLPSKRFKRQTLEKESNIPAYHDVQGVIVDEALGGAERHQLGVTTFRSPETFDPAELERARNEIQRHIESIPGVAASRVTRSQGMYGGYVEPTIDAEFTAPQGTDLSRLHAAVRDISQGSGQEASFVTRVHNDLDAPGARPILEVGFHRPASEDQLQQLMTQFSDHALGGFTVARDRQGKAMGIRSQSIPEFDSSVNPSDHQAYHEDWKGAANVLSAKLEKDPNITYRKIRAADTRIYTDRVLLGA